MKPDRLGSKGVEMLPPPLHRQQGSPPPLDGTPPSAPELGRGGMEVEMEDEPVSEEAEGMDE